MLLKEVKAMHDACYPTWEEQDQKDREGEETHTGIMTKPG